MRRQLPRSMRQHVCTAAYRPSRALDSGAHMIAQDQRIFDFTDRGSRREPIKLPENARRCVGVASNGYAAQRYPTTLKAVGEAGHEIIAHGWTNDAGTPSGDEDTE